MTVQEIIKFLGGTALVLAAVAWLVRSLVAHVLSRDIELFKERLQAQSAVQLERLRHELRLVAAEHEKRIHLLQERRAHTIAELHSKIMDFLAAAESFASLMEYSGEPSKREKARLLDEKAGEFHKYFLRNRIYFSEDVCEKVETLFREVHDSSVGLSIWLAKGEKGAGDYSTQINEAWGEAWRAMKDKVPPLVKAIEAEFRELLGVVPGDRVQSD